ncbi:MAG: Histidine biosynthesis bifunctional protein HisIE [Caldanaerobacter subterraneus]|jgi:phosphoribosyl-ATP pyrophosphohydrolase/phosphoribosyl-AMP cyclohydrolase|uniref:Histidine biosynthesis bifunctional protein HisIE n=4 Tax=Caldanaerobacter subterraneus TaxID=911092 RepID=HIS2_CALS4|nr:MULTISPECIES: bifunctional phosphoribosyl-AMP cyclohydrolase/phosphoribosyl-ATP diphosphatase HisIE [Caldanaerobacter]Q8R886.1 RecName: Full=Histidine biosynthesis bifunctional protein HisIE; Includes: RecName: Full=Phosphoribosyl-AMP cyclohydrolase; Short=PRA-CH; Includes: RecName: Full=Phosphoribosyl-ATP pyrophosphatase; Short=PRA-PH [Caldanaerobacter subterraneus subsp. tengcongensis MB4]AAM25297.1 Phosphoribosyl-AMP cyclohydrolase [Caldanaerobacter subterraneus subsp. tengcongensis MB4]ER
MIDIKELKFDEKGLIPAIVQDYYTKQVLMLAYMNEESLKLTLEKGETYFFSRSRGKIWHKGETSGNTQKVKKIFYDCDEDALLIQVEAKGPACHTGNISCFYRSFDEETEDGIEILNKLYERIKGRKINPVEGSYTNYLFEKGIDKILKKVGEEATEVVIASKNDSKDEIVYEVSDLIYHLMVLLVEKNITLNDIYNELERRYKK